METFLLCQRSIAPPSPGACATIICWILWIQAISYHGKLAIHPTPLIPVYRVP